MFLVKCRANGLMARCIEESCPATFDNCFGVKNSWFKYVLISSKIFEIFSCGTVKVNSLVPITVPNHFSFVLGLKSLFSLLITNPVERRSCLTSSLMDLVI